MPNSVKHFHSSQPGAPVLSGTAGTMVDVLDACLVNGFGVCAVASLVVSDGVATATVSAGHPAEVGQVVLISGASPGDLNGEKRVLTTGAGNTVLTFDATGVTNQTATGTISLRIAPAGWLKSFSGTNLAAYKSGNVAATGCYLRVDDTGTTDARVRGYESMSDISTGTGLFRWASGDGYWPKASASGATARAWSVIADDRTMWLFASCSATPTFANGIVVGFGDFESYKSGDAWACALHGPSTSIASSAANSVLAVSYAGSASATSLVARSFTGLGNTVSVYRYPELNAVSAFYSGATQHLAAYPNGPNNGLILSRALLAEPAPAALRGIMRGVHYAMQDLGSNTFNGRIKIDGQGPLAGRKLMSLCGAAPAGTANTNVTMFVDITGPWE